ncbi:RHS repeat-associated core domain protein [Propionibacterium acidifaciens F0233]|uniref:RHS repeat-associated core domain protein n=1 Tax=Propionibacterium acidifaciens F0233 TaxID=553198 RepID=U2Q1N8_9ACTN|nr:DUF6531 domain-containing protein [Propionibacterium acidifaciens]AYW77502.1 type IV secretion protein Rhs [Propionibacterium acidifaciens]ERK49914.1 RHS repeat-associated core domain protein [Propionibacterium acidifaciens F0233]
MAEYSGRLGAYDEPVAFDDATADTLKSAATVLSGTLTGQAASRSSWASTASTDFEGHYADVFDTNARMASTDCTNIASALDDLVAEVQKLKEAAQAERERRRRAKEWADRQDRENIVKRGWDWVSNGDKPPAGPAQVPLPQPHEVTTTPWSEPAPGQAGGVSSARPDDLRTYSSNVTGANDTVTTQKGTLEGALSDFADRCSWCSIDTSGITTALASFGANNTNETRWVDTVAAAFEAAGGSGAISAVSDAALDASLQAAGVARTRRPVDVTAPTILGDPQTSGYADDPVNTTTGNFVEPETDLSFDGGCASLGFDRVYNSLSAGIGAFGPGWASTADQRLLVTEDGAVWVQPSGRHVVFPRLGNGWDRAHNDTYWLHTTTDTTGPTPGDAPTTGAAGGAGVFVVSDNAGGRWVFDRAGRPVSVSRGPGTRVDHRWDGDRLVGLTHERGRAVTIEWNDHHTRITALAASDGRRVDYGYDPAGRLLEARTAGGARRYGWNEQGLIATVTDPDGVVEAANTYNEHGQVTSQRSRFGRLSHYTYLPGGVTQVADEDGGRANTWIHDQTGRLVGMVDADGNRQSIGWDQWGNRVQITGRDGRTTVCRYDARGRLITRQEASGARTDYEWDEADRVVQVTVTDTTSSSHGNTSSAGGSGPSVTSYEYEGAGRNPSTVTDPEGGVTRLVWDQNLLTEVVDPAGVRVRLGYDGHGDLVSAMNADGDTARLARDGAGRVVAAVTPLGHRTEYRYDEAGRLASRQDPDGALWRYEHTTGGRLSAVVDPDGCCRRYGYGGHGERETFTDPLGEVVTSRWDDLGNLAETVMPDGARWRYVHDGLSRLVATVDPAGGAWRREYDVNGALAATVDPTGVRVDWVTSNRGRVRTVSDGAASGAVRTDGLGRVTVTTGDDGADRVTRYDRCGRPVEFIDGEGNTTRLVRDPAGRVNAVVRPSGAVTRYGYDVCGRLARVTDPAGGVACFVYDGDSRLVEEARPGGERAWWSYDECGRVTVKHAPGYGTTRYAYDRSGRVTGLADPVCGRRRFRYDRAGNLVEAVSGTGGVTRYGYDTAGALVQVTDPAGGVTRYERDELGRVVKLVDPLGRVTVGEYDAAGRQTSQTGPDGHVTGWSYDRTGRFEALSWDGAVHHRVVRDFVNRLMRVTETGGVTHTVRWDHAGRLVERARDGRAVSWGYDADGRRAWMRTPDGRSVRYGYDPAGRLTQVTSSAFGRVVYEYGPSGRMVAATAGGTRQEWEHTDGFVTGHIVRHGGVVSHTAVGRDEQGRVAWTSRDGAHTAYTYDGANQLTATTGDGGTTAFTWDPAGRLVAETTPDGGRVDYTWDAAGQLTRVDTTGRDTGRDDGGRDASRDGDGRDGDGGEGLSVWFSYDAAGRRVREEHADGTIRTYGWGPLARLETVTIDSALERARTSLFTDALGELAALDGRPLDWDTAVGFPSLLSAADTSMISVPGFTATTGAGWQTPGWRTTRTTGGTDPWAAGAGTPLDTTPAAGGGLLLGRAGELVLPGGLELLGARVYDPTTRAFLSPDPQDPTTGAGWAGNPYAYAANNPVAFTDPSGLHPLSDADMNAWRDAHKTGVAAAGDWLKDNWEYIAAGAAVVAGVALMCTGVGGPAGVALMSLSGALTSGGISIAQQKATNGSVDWARVGTEAAIGAIPVPGGGGAAAGREAAETAGREALEATGREVAETTGREAAEQAARTTGEHELSTIGTDAAENVGEHASQTNYIYSSRVLNRSAEAGDSFHNFPQSFDEEIILQGQRKVTPGFWEKDVPNLSNDNVMYRLSGEINGHPGIYEIATRPSVSERTEVIMHRFFNTR